jgi:hypothetical protein
VQVPDHVYDAKVVSKFNVRVLSYYLKFGDGLSVAALPSEVVPSDVKEDQVEGELLSVLDVVNHRINHRVFSFGAHALDLAVFERGLQLFCPPLILGSVHFLDQTRVKERHGID